MSYHTSPVSNQVQLVSSKYLTAFSDFRHSANDPDFLSTEGFCLYLDAYATHFNLWPHISLSTKVVSVKRIKGSGHMIISSFEGRTESWECDAIAVCSGLHTVPCIPPIPGIEHVPCRFHSADFRSRKDFGEDKHVLILGAGETAMDLGYLAVTSPTKSVTICHRDGFYYAPKVTVYLSISSHFINVLGCTCPCDIQDIQQVACGTEKYPHRYYSHESI